MKNNHNIVGGDGEDWVVFTPHSYTRAFEWELGNKCIVPESGKRDSGYKGENDLIISKDIPIEELEDAYARAVPVDYRAMPFWLGSGCPGSWF